MFCPMGVLFAMAIQISGVAPAVADTPFAQEYHEGHVLVAGKAEANDVRAVAVDAAGNVWAGTADGVYVLPEDGTEWKPAMTSEQAGPVYDLAASPEGVVYAAAWNGLFACALDGARRVGADESPRSVVWIDLEGQSRSLGPTDKSIETGSDPIVSANLRAALPTPKGLWLATGAGLYHLTGGATTLYRVPVDILSSDVTGVALAADGRLWAGCLGGITVYEDGRRVETITPADGLPSVNIQCVACAPDGVMWVGTDLGVTRCDGKTWSLRHSRRWLMDDDVRDVAFGVDGTAWVATAGGISAIKRRELTLAQKAEHFEKISMERHVREPFIVEKCVLPKPGDLSQWKPVDDDNDGSYTGQYMVAQCYRYAATGEPEAKEKARKAFDFLVLLQTITDTPGFVARTIVPADWKEVHDPGEDYTAREEAERRVRDPRFKPVKDRWLPSKDGKWLWKRDTSSDEMTGHFWCYGIYYDLAAETPEEKERVRAHVRKVMDYLIEGGYVLRDIDGTHTRWGVWAPERLNHDPEWSAERGINSLEILSYLKTTYHITGDEKYQEEYLTLARDHHYAENVLHAKTYAPAWITHIDTELLAMAYPALMAYEEDPELKAVYRASFDEWYRGTRHEFSPYFNFTYGAFTEGGDQQLNDSLFFLRDAPLDLINWTVDNAPREDLRVVREPVLEARQVNRLLPPSERGVVRWDKNPWDAIQGDGAHTEWAPTYWLLPYWMGRYYGFISAP